MKSKICVYFASPHSGALPKHFDSWFDFADYVKQETLTGRPVTIYQWDYVHV